MPKRTAIQQLRVAVVTDDNLFREGLIRILSHERTFTVVEASACHVLVLDGRMEDAFARCGAVKREGGARIVLVAAPLDPTWVNAALAAGARGILARTARPEDLLKAVRVVHDGQIWASRRAIEAWAQSMAAAPRRHPAADALERDLSGREREVLQLAAEGLGNREVADRLFISQATVKVHLGRIFQKLGLRGRTELAAAYHGVIRRPEGAKPGAAVPSRPTSARAPLPLRRPSYD